MPYNENKIIGGMKMDNYYVEFLGELKGDKKIQNRFVKHYDKWCDTINQYLEEINQKFDAQWKGEPITDYAELQEYHDWMLKHYKYILKKSGLKNDLVLEYEIGDELQLIGIKRHGNRKGSQISFVLKRR